MKTAKKTTGYFLRRVLGFFVIPLLLFGMTETVARMLHIPKISHNNIEAKAQQVLPQADEQTLLIVGDSRLEWGLQPLFMEDSLRSENIRVLNMAMPGSNGLDVMQYIVRNKIKLKGIVTGVSPFFGRYTNHGMDKIELSLRNCLYENGHYRARQVLYSMDNSIANYYENGYPYFKSHHYDEQGGAVVEAWGGYDKRYAFQRSMYKKWNAEFSPEKLAIYTNTLNKLADSLRQLQVPVYAVYMPVSRNLFAFEADFKGALEQQLHLDSYSDYSGFVYTGSTAEHDSIFFYDGSHLSHAYAKKFSALLAGHIREIRKQQRVKQK
jgi:hypothetical protein